MNQPVRCAPLLRAGLGLFLVLLTGCAAPQYSVPDRGLDEVLPEVAPLDLRVAVLVPESVASATYGRGQWGYVYDGITSSILRMAAATFRESQQVTSAPVDGSFDAVLEPKNLRVAETQGGGLDLVQTITIPWELRAASNDGVITEFEATGQGENYAGTMFNIKSQAVKRAVMAVNETLASTSAILASSVSVDQFSQFPELFTASEQDRTAMALSRLQSSSSQEHASLGMAALYFAADHDDAALASALAQDGIAVDVDDPRRRGTPLIVAARSGHSNTVRALLEGGAEINQRDPDGHTALFHFVQQSLESEAENLIALGATVHPVDANPEDLYFTARAFDLHANHLEANGQASEARRERDSAKQSFLAAAESYEERADQLKSAISKKKLWGSLLLGLGQAAISVGNAYQAQQQQKQFAQISALRQASSSGGGPSAYYQNLRTLEQSSPSPVFYSPLPSGADSMEETLKSGALPRLRQIEAAYRALAEDSRSRAEAL